MVKEWNLHAQQHADIFWKVYPNIAREELASSEPEKEEHVACEKLPALARGSGQKSYRIWAKQLLSDDLFESVVQGFQIEEYRVAV